MGLLSNIRRSPKALAAKHGAPVKFYSHPDTEMVRLNAHGDALRARDMFEGVQIMGGTGSGKSSASARVLALAMLRANWGGLVLCAKPGEAERWIGYLRETGRTAHLIRATPDGPCNFNFLDYEAHRPDGAGHETYNLVALIELMMEVSASALMPTSGGEGAAFWILSRREGLANAIEPLVAARGCLRLDDIMQMFMSAPKSRAEAFSEEWKQRSNCYKRLSDSYERPLGPQLKENQLRAAADYWFGTFAELDPKTRSNIVATLTSAISPFLRGTLYDRFCTNTNIIPEMTHEGAVIVWDFPVKVWGAAGVVAAQLFKYQWQKATERRTIGPHTRPVFLFADECQFFVSEYDAEFQSTARSSMAATVYITQNLPTYYSRMRGREPKVVADSMLGNFQTKIFHANTDSTTNQYAADLIGKSIHRRSSQNWSASDTEQINENHSSNWGTSTGESRGTNWGSNRSFGSSSGGQGHSSFNSSSGSSSGSQKGTNRSRSNGGGYSYGSSSSTGTTGGGGWSEQVDYTIQPAEFAACLRKGGAADGGLVDGIIVQGGRRFAASGAHWIPCTFRQ